MNYSASRISNELCTGLLCDVLDILGYRNQSIASLRTITIETTFYGKAFTAVADKIFEPVKQPLKKQCKVYESASEGDVFVITIRGDAKASIFGEIMATTLKTNGVNGAVIDGCIRDLVALKKLNFPFCYKATNPANAKGRLEVVEYQTPIYIENVKINPGDYIFCDPDGMVVIPKNLHDKVITMAFQIKDNEYKVKERILRGEKLSEAYFDM